MIGLDEILVFDLDGYSDPTSPAKAKELIKSGRGVRRRYSEEIGDDRWYVQLLPESKEPGAA